MEKKYEDYLLTECSKKGLNDRDKIEYILDYKERYNLTWKEIANLSGFSAATLKYNMKLLQIPHEEYDELKELGFTSGQISRMIIPKEHNPASILKNFINNLDRYGKHLTKDNLEDIRKIITRMNEIKYKLEMIKVNG